MKTENASGEETASADVVVVGAGIAGLVAARALAEAGYAVLLLEARERIGGRIFSQAVPGVDAAVELGAEFIHGQPQDLLQLLEEARLESYELGQSPFTWDGASIERDEDDELHSILDRLRAYPRQDARQDRSFADYLEGQHLPEATARQANGYIEGFNAADANRISMQSLAAQQLAEDAIEGDRLFHVRHGYSALVKYVAGRFTSAGGQLRLQHVVNGIHWSRHRVSVVAARAGGERLAVTAKRVLITAPLGVLQSDGLGIEPRPAAFHALEQMAMGPVHRISFVFTRRFWAESPYSAEDLGFLFAQEAVPSVWWTGYPSVAPVLTSWIGGRRVQEIEASELLDTALATLARIFNLSRAALDALVVSTHTHDWNSDPFSRGAYSYVCIGGIDASSALSQPIEDTLFLAGEHTDVTGHWGTVHGALRSGVRAAGQLIESLGR